MKVRELVSRVTAASESADPMNAVRKVLESMRDELAEIDRALGFISGVGGNARQVFFRSPKLFMLKARFPAGRRTPPHNHGTWAVVAGVDGLERNAFWKRLADGSRPGYAKIAKVTEKDFGPGEVTVSLHAALKLQR